MRALALALVLAACSPEIGYDTYLCGDEAACPPGQACNGPDNHCVSASLAQPFACDPTVEHDDNTVATATPIPLVGCVTNLTSIPGCLADGDPEDWYSFAVPANCAAVVAHLHISYPLSFEEVPFALADQDGVALEQSGDCGSDETSLAGLGLVDKCLKRTVTPGKTFTVHVTADPTLSCGGACAFNRYTLSLQLQLP